MLLIFFLFSASERKTSSRKRVSVARFQVSPSGTPTATSLRSSQPTVHSTDPDEFTDAYPREDTQIDRENILFVYLDLHSQLLPQMVTSLRAINDHVRTFDNDALCFDFLQTSPDRVFFICPTTDKDLVKAVHELSAVEAIFILGSDAQLDRTRLPKIDGVYNNFEELLLGLRCTLEWFEQTQMEVFAVEKDRVFLWSQLWKEEVRRSPDLDSGIDARGGLFVVSEADACAPHVEQRDAGERSRELL